MYLKGQICVHDFIVSVVAFCLDADNGELS
jgi:hypothetical protein